MVMSAVFDHAPAGRPRPLSANVSVDANDKATRATLSRFFQGRVIKSLDVDCLARWGGCIHCVTMQQAAR